MFIELHQLLLQSRQFSREYWEDCALPEAEDYLRRFEASDWKAMEDSLSSQPFHWRFNCIEVLKQHPSPPGLTMLGRLCYDPEKTIAREARHTVSRLAKRSKPEHPCFDQLQKLNAELSGSKRKWRFFPIFE